VFPTNLGVQDPDSRMRGNDILKSIVRNIVHLGRVGKSVALPTIVVGTRKRTSNAQRFPTTGIRPEAG
jgi:hypothetical protein